MLEDKLKALAEYEVDFKFQKDWFVIGVTYKPQWMVVEPDNPRIEYLETEGRYYYGAPVDSIKVDEIFDCINETIKYNKDIERKMDLFNTKVEELQGLFANETFEDLMTLEFKFKRKKQTPRQAKTDKSKNDKTSKEETKTIEMTSHVESIPDPNLVAGSPVDSIAVNHVESELYDDGVVFVDTIAEAYKEAQEKNNKTKVN